MAGSQTIGLLRIILTANTAEFSAAMKASQKEMAAWTKTFKSVGQQTTAIGQAMTKAISLPIAAGFAGAVKAAADFESSFAGVKKTVNATAPEFAKLAQGLRDMAKEVPINVNELNKVAESAGQLGIRKDDILQFTRTMADLGVTTNLTADEAATATAQFQNIFGAAGKDVDRFGATLVALGNDGASTEKDIIAMGLRIAGAGHQIGMSQGQVLAYASALSSVGINAEAGGTAISRVFLKINDAVMSGSPALAEFARVAGMSAQGFKDAFQRDAAGATAAFISGLARLKGEGENVNQTIEGLVGKSVQIKDTLNRASGAGALLTDALALQAKAWAENTALTKEAAERYNTFYSQLAKVWAQVRDVGITIGTALLPTLRDLMSALQPVLGAVASLAEGFASLPGPVRVVTLGVAGLAAAAGPVIYVFGQVALSASALTTALTANGVATLALTRGLTSLGVYLPTFALGIRAAGTAAAWSAVQLGAMAAAMAPVAAGAVVLGSLTATLTAGYQAWKLWGESAERARLATEQNKSHMLALAEASKLAGRQVTDVAEAQNILRAHAEKLRSALTAQHSAQDAVSSSLKSGVSPALGQTKEELKAAKEAADAFAKALSKFGGADAIAEARELEKVLAALGGPTKVLPSQLQQMSDAFAEAAEAARTVGNVKLSDEFKRQSDALKPITVFQRTFNVTIGQYVPIANAAAAATEAVWEQFYRLTGQVQKILPELKNLMDLSKHLWDGFKQPVEQNPPGRQIGEEILDGIKDALGELPDLLKQAFTGGGGIAGAFKALGVLLADAIMKPLMEQWTKFQKLASGVGSTIAAGVGGSVGGSTLATVAGLAGSIGGAAIMATGFGAAMAGAIGTTAALGVATAGVGLAVVGVYAAYKKWFTVSPEVKKAREDLVKFQDAITGTLTETQKAEAGGEKWKETLIGVRDAYIELGMTADEAVAASNRDVGEMFDTDNPERSRAAIARVGEAYAALEAKRKVLADGTAEATGLFDQLTAAAAEMGNTMPDSLRPMIDQLVEMGVVSEETAAKLAGIGKEGDVDWKAMEAAAKKYGIEMEGLGGKFQGARLNADAKDIWTTFQMLTSGGADVNRVLEGMKDEISKLVQDSIHFGTTIPENLRPLIQNLMDSGRLVDENGDKITDMGKIKFGDPLVDQFKEISDKLGTLIDEIKNGLIAALHDIPPRVNTTVTTTYETEGQPPSGQDPPAQFATGSGGIRDFGAGTPAILHGREGVFTESQLKAIQAKAAADAVAGVLGTQTPGFDTSSSLARVKALMAASTAAVQVFARDFPSAASQAGQAVASAASRMASGLAGVASGAAKALSAKLGDIITVAGKVADALTFQTQGSVSPEVQKQIDAFQAQADAIKAEQEAMKDASPLTQMKRDLEDLNTAIDQAGTKAEKAALEKEKDALTLAIRAEERRLEDYQKELDRQIYDIEQRIKELQAQKNPLEGFALPPEMLDAAQAIARVQEVFAAYGGAATPGDLAQIATAVQFDGKSIAASKLDDYLKKLVDSFLQQAYNPAGFAATLAAIQEQAAKDARKNTPGFAGGSGGIVDFGSETLARLHGREAVLTEDQLAGVGARAGSPDVVSAIHASNAKLLRALRGDKRADLIRARDARMGAL